MLCVTSDKTSWMLKRWKISYCTSLTACFTTVNLLGNTNTVIAY